MALAVQAINSWDEEANIHHKLSSAYNPEGNGEAEISVKKVKLAISHASDKFGIISATVANLNCDQRIRRMRIFQTRKGSLHSFYICY